MFVCVAGGVGVFVWVGVCDGTVVLVAVLLGVEVDAAIVPVGVAVGRLGVVTGVGEPCGGIG